MPDDFSGSQTLNAVELQCMPAVVSANRHPVILEDLCPPVGMDGSCGCHRFQVQCKISAQTDIEAVGQWIASSESEPCARGRKAAAEKLLNWAYLQRGKALSSFDQPDFAAFSRFLAAPEPVALWIGPQCARRGSDTWRPFNGPLAANSLSTTMSHVRSLVNYLQRTLYADIPTVKGQREFKYGLSDSAIVTRRRESLKKAAPLPKEEWHWIRRVLDISESNERSLDRRLLVELLAYGSLKLREILDLRVCDVLRPTAFLPCWIIRVNGRRIWRGGEYLFAPPPLATTLSRWLEAALGPEVAGHPCQLQESNFAPLIPLRSDVARNLVRRTILDAADMSKIAGLPLMAQQLASRSLVWLSQMLAPPGEYGCLERYIEVPSPFVENVVQGVHLMKVIRRDWLQIESYWTPFAPTPGR